MFRQSRDKLVGPAMPTLSSNRESSLGGARHCPSLVVLCCMYYILLLPPNSHAFSLGGGSSSAPACQPLGLVSRTVSATNGESSSSSSSSSNHAEPFMSLEGPSTAYFDPQCEGESCLLASEDDSTFASALTEHELRLTQLIDAFLFYIPILSPILAFFTYETVAAVSDDTIHFLAQNTWVAVDGGIYEAKMIAPAINGVVVPAITILFATLLSNTFTTLRQRQQDVRTAINTEAGELRVLSSMVDSFEPKSTQRQCRSYLLQYTSRLIAESQQGNEYQNLVAGDSEMNGFLTTLNGMTRSETPSIIVSESYAAVTRLNSERSQRISSLQSTFPALHFGILTALAISICLAFLMETNLDVLIFLNAIQLKILWTMLIGTFSALGVVCYDLGDPFRGSYQISKTVHQLYTIRDAVKASENM